VLHSHLPCRLFHRCLLATSPPTQSCLTFTPPHSHCLISSLSQVYKPTNSIMFTIHTTPFTPSHSHRLIHIVLFRLFHRSSLATSPPTRSCLTFTPPHSHLLIHSVSFILFHRCSLATSPPTRSCLTSSTPSPWAASSQCTSIRSLCRCGLYSYN